LTGKVGVIDLAESVLHCHKACGLVVKLYASQRGGRGFEPYWGCNQVFPHDPSFDKCPGSGMEKFPSNRLEPRIDSKKLYICIYLVVLTVLHKNLCSKTSNKLEPF
jgi:hypothetical protein